MKEDDAPALDLVEGFEEFHEIGSGGFSTVYGAIETRMSRPVAIKVLGGDSASGDLSVFERECRAMGILSRHPNIVTVYSAATTVAGRPCLVMERFHGTYRQRIADHLVLSVTEVP
ncbi:MAG: protein kinase, partial [Ilumatobacter sp.]